jgi:ESCRT-I complex subunit VPS28
VQPLRAHGERELRAWATREEREKLEAMSTLFGIIKATDRLEALWARGLIPADDYTPLCRDLIGQFDLAERQLRASGAIRSVHEFCSEHKIRCVAGIMRLEAKVPATAETVHGSHSDTQTYSLLMDGGVAFVTALDAIEMNQRTREELWTPIQDVSSLLLRIPSLSDEFEATTKMRAWLQTLRDMGVTDELDEDQVRQLKFDLQTSYDALKAHFNMSTRRSGTGSSGHSSGLSSGGAATGGASSGASTLPLHTS